MGWIDQMISIIGTSKIDQLSSVIVGVNTATDSTCWACVRSRIPSSLTKLPSTVNALYPKPMPFGGMGKPVNQNGFSDHFPITMTVIEAD